MQPSQNIQQPATRTSLLPSTLGFGAIAFYILFTLLPNSNSLMVKWPWVFIWQFGLMLGPVLLLFQLWQGSFRKLGRRLDWLPATWCIGLTLSATFAQFTHQAFWYTWPAICGIAFLYVLNSWLTSASRTRSMLIFQGILSIIFSAYSLIAWLVQTVKPQLQVLEQLKGYGIEKSFDLQELTLRNWHPVGHQNYVAGYLVLVLPLLAGLVIAAKGKARLGWLAGFAFSLATLYSTASRGSLLGVAASTFVFISFSIWHYPKLRKRLLSGGFISFVAILLWGFSSDRIRTSILSLFSQSATDQPAYRTITNATGWFMGLDHPILGAGLGSVTLLYQKYRPAWSGADAEITYQLHSTPAQLWAELGLAGAVLTVVSLIVIAYLSLHSTKNKALEFHKETISRPILIGIVSGLVGYSVYATTDYQLDNICINGTIIIFVATLIFANRETITEQSSPANMSLARRITLAGTGLLVAVSIWLYPIHRAWMLSSQGFLALQQEDIPTFVTYLEQAHQLAPWEPYYPYQLGWNLGELAFQSADAQQQARLAEESVEWFEIAITLSPNREFGYSNLGWLLVNLSPEKATAAFLKATQLVPHRSESYFALGYSLLKEGKTDLSIQAMTIALAQQPVLLTSPVWKSPELVTIYPKVLDSFEAYLQQQSASSSDTWQRRAYQTKGMLHWWKSEFDLAEKAFSHNPSDINKALMALTESRYGDAAAKSANNELPTNLILAIWARSDSKDLLFKTTLLNNSTVTPVDEAALSSLFVDIESSATAASSFHTWLTQLAPSVQRRNQRLGFGTISRHIDGPLVRDFSATTDNMLMRDYLPSLIPVSTSSSGIDQMKKVLEAAMSVQLGK
ncbi:MAG: O-antigen ligase family protein [Cyanobacteria bacterium J06581_3]